MRAIKSFVMRAGRMTEGQQRGLDQGWPKFGLELADGLRDFDQVFGRSAPRTFEIGFGMGHSTLLMAAAAPEQDFIGVEVHRPGVGALLNGALAQNLIENQFDRSRRRAMEQRVAKLREHFIVCGFGRVGRQTCLQLQRESCPFVVIDNQEQRLQEIAAASPRAEPAPVYCGAGGDCRGRA